MPSTPQRWRCIPSAITLLSTALMFIMSSFLLVGNVASLLIHVRIGLLNSQSSAGSRETSLLHASASTVKLQRAINIAFYVEVRLLEPRD